MSKEKTRAELHAEVADLKAKLENEVKHATEVRAEYANLDAAHKALRSEHEACEKSLNQANKVIVEKNAKISMLEKRVIEEEGKRQSAENCAESRKRHIDDICETIKKLQERCDNQNARIERMQADLDKAQYIAADLLEHGVLHFLIVKYRNLRAK